MATEDRGFASMERNKQREIASKGGKAAHQKGTAHEWTSEEAREAGRKGGMASHRRKQEQQGGSAETDMENPRDTGDSGPVHDEPRDARTTSRYQSARLPLASASVYNRKFVPFEVPRLVLGGRPTVGRMPLEHVIGVRIPASQPTLIPSSRALTFTSTVAAE